MELHFKYYERIEATNRNDDDADDDEDEIYLKKLDAGLYTLQLIDYIILEISSESTNIPSIRQRILQILNLRSTPIDLIKETVRGSLVEIRFVKKKISFLFFLRIR